MCDNQLDANGFFTILVIRAKYDPANSNAVQLQVKSHKSKFDLLTVLKMCVEELKINIQELNNEM